MNSIYFTNPLSSNNKMSFINAPFNYDFSLTKVLRRKEQEEQKLAEIDADLAILLAAKADALARNRFIEVVKEVAENLAEDAAFTAPMTHTDYKVMPRDRKTRVDVLTPYEASKSCKSSRHCKLKPKTPSRDQTKTPKSKAHSKNKQYSSNRKDAAWDY